MMLWKSSKLLVSTDALCSCRLQISPDKGNELEFATTLLPNKMETSSLSLRFMAQKEHFRNGILKLKCVATIPTVYRLSQETAAEIYLKDDDRNGAGGQERGKKGRKESSSRMSAGESSFFHYSMCFPCCFSNHFIVEQIIIWDEDQRRVKRGLGEGRLSMTTPASSDNLLSHHWLTRYVPFPCPVMTAKAFTFCLLCHRFVAWFKQSQTSVSSFVRWGRSTKTCWSTPLLLLLSFPASVPFWFLCYIISLMEYAVCTRPYRSILAAEWGGKREGQDMRQQADRSGRVWGIHTHTHTSLHQAAQTALIIFPHNNEIRTKKEGEKRHEKRRGTWDHEDAYAADEDFDDFCLKHAFCFLIVLQVTAICKSDRKACSKEQPFTRLSAILFQFMTPLTLFPLFSLTVHSGSAPELPIATPAIIAITLIAHFARRRMQ